MDNIYKEVEFLNGDKCQIILPTIKDLSSCMRKYQEQKEEEDKLDIYPFLIESLCRFNGVKKDLKFILNLSGDVYFNLVPVLTELTNSSI